MTEPDTIEGEAPPKQNLRNSSEQVAILQCEYDRGASLLNNTDIDMEIDMKQEGIGRKVVPDDVKNWMYAKARKARGLALLSNRAGQECQLRTGEDRGGGETLSMVKFYP
jgi:hypothetical protein